MVKAILRQKTELEESVALAPDYTAKLQDQNSMALAKKQTCIHRSMGQDVHSIYTESIQGQWKNTESPQVNLHNYGHLICEKGGKYTTKKSQSSINCAGKLDSSM